MARTSRSRSPVAKASSTSSSSVAKAVAKPKAQLRAIPKSPSKGKGKGQSQPNATQLRVREHVRFMRIFSDIDCSTGEGGQIAVGTLGLVIQVFSDGALVQLTGHEDNWVPFDEEHDLPTIFLTRRDCRRVVVLQ